MRAAIYAVMTSLWFMAHPSAFAGNGETGILIKVQTFEFVEDTELQMTTLVLCTEDMEQISRWLKEGYVTSILLPGYGVFTVKATPEGGISLEQSKIEILSRDCHVAVKPSC